MNKSSIKMAKSSKKFINFLLQSQKHYDILKEKGAKTMRRGLLSFVVYLIYTLLGGGTAIYNYIALQKHNAEGGGLEGLGLAILLIAGIIVFAIGLVGLIFKSLHMNKGWRFFGVLCLLLDVACVIIYLYLFLGEGMTPVDTLGIFAVAIPSILSAISNLLSLRR